MNVLMMLVLSAPPQVPAPPQAPTISEERLAALEAQVASIERRLDRVELALELTPERGVPKDKTLACRCENCACDPCVCVTNTAAMPVLPKLYVATAYACPHCDRLKAFLDANGVRYETIADNAGQVPRFTYGGRTVIGNDPDAVMGVLGRNDGTNSHLMQPESVPYMEAAEPRKRGGGPVRRLGRFLFGRKNKARGGFAAPMSGANYCESCQ